MNIIKKSLGLVDGMETLEVTDADTGEIIGYDQTAPASIEEIPDEPQP
jgi:hypothetical protein